MPSRQQHSKSVLTNSDHSSVDPLSHDKNLTNFVGHDFQHHNHVIKSYLSAKSGFFYEAKLIESIQSQYQLVSIWKSDELGCILVLDDQLMCAESDEQYYHEALIYPALIFKHALQAENHLAINSTNNKNPSPLRCLIVSGGDGGSCEELLKQSSVSHIDLVEIDGVVVELSQKYLTSVHENAFTHEKVTLKIEDGFYYLKVTSFTDNLYDLIYLDLNDPIGTNPVVALYTDEFFQNLSHSLTDGGIAVMQIGAANYNAGFETAQRLALSHFASVVLYTAYCPSYHCMNYFCMMSNTDDLSMVDTVEASKQFFTEFSKSAAVPTKIMDSDNFRAYFSIPKDVRQIHNTLKTQHSRAYDFTMSPSYVRTTQFSAGASSSSLTPNLRLIDDLEQPYTHQQKKEQQ